MTRKGCGDFCHPNLKFPRLQPVLRWELCTAILFCSNPIKYLSHNLSRKLSLCSIIVPKISICETEMTQHSRHHNSHLGRIFTCELFVQIATDFLQISRSWAKSQLYALDVCMFEDLTLMRLRSGDIAEEARGWRMSEGNVNGASQSFLGLTHRLAEIRQNGRLQV